MVIKKTIKYQNLRKTGQNRIKWDIFQKKKKRFSLPKKGLNRFFDN